jgi:hypothetical protein
MSCSGWNDKHVSFFKVMCHSISNILSIISGAVKELDGSVVWWTPNFIDKVGTSQDGSTATRNHVDLGDEVMFGNSSSARFECATMRDGDLDLRFTNIDGPDLLVDKPVFPPNERVLSKFLRWDIGSRTHVA